MLHYLQFFRGLSALSVLLYHSSEISQKYTHKNSILKIFKLSTAGVNFFFVLSGFIILFIHKKDINNIKKLSDYLIKRFIRVYPIYWLTFIITLPFYILFYQKAPPILGIAKSFFLIQHTNIVYVAWTLVHEVMFYILFGTCIINFNLARIILGAWLFLILTENAKNIFFDSWSYDPNSYHSFIFSNYNLLFFFGMFAAYLLHEKKGSKLSLYYGLVGIISFFSCATIEILTEMNSKLDIFYGISSFLIIYGFSNWEKNYLKTKPIIPKFFLILGSASYSIYLIHSQIITGIVKIFIKLKIIDSFNVIILFILTSLISLTFGIIFHIHIEKPLLEFFKKKIS